jgi:hypothetical protein
MTNLKHESMIDQVIDKFNFEKVYVAMTALDWKWSTTAGNGYEIPTLARLKAMARVLLRESVADKQVVSGGLVATYHPKDKEDPEYFDLKFVLHQADSYYEDD